MLNISGYHFRVFEADVLPELQQTLLTYGQSLDLIGTVLLTTEGMNINLSGSAENLKTFQQYLVDEELVPDDLHYHLTTVETTPYRRMRVRIRKELITFRQEDLVSPAEKKAPYLKPEELKTWYQDGKDMLVLDTRNLYEFGIGKFQDAHTLNINSFSDLPQFLHELPADARKKPIVTYCTGGIRCEKAAHYLKEQGFEEVYQLEGGILNYFNTCGGEYYEGECFVFDKRIAVDAHMNETATIQCKYCRRPMTKAEQKASPEQCVACGNPYPKDKSTVGIQDGAVSDSQ